MHTNKKNSIIYYNNKLELIKKNKYNIFFLDNYNYDKLLKFKFFQLYLSQYLQNIYNIKLQEKNINCIDILPSHLTQNFLYKVRHVNFKHLGIKYFNEVGYLFLVNI